VLCLRKVSVIYLEHKSPYVFSNLPPDIGRATLHASVYVILQPIRRTASRVTTKPGELLPHLFTLTPTTFPVPLLARHPLQRREIIGKCYSERLFSVTLLCPYKQLPVRKYGALRCPDFPLFHKGKATNRPTI